MYPYPLLLQPTRSHGLIRSTDVQTKHPALKRVHIYSTTIFINESDPTLFGQPMLQEQQQQQWNMFHCSVFGMCCCKSNPNGSCDTIRLYLSTMYWTRTIKYFKEFLSHSLASTPTVWGYMIRSTYSALGIHMVLWKPCKAQDF